MATLEPRPIWEPAVEQFVRKHWPADRVICVEGRITIMAAAAEDPLATIWERVNTLAATWRREEISEVSPTLFVRAGKLVADTPGDLMARCQGHYGLWRREAWFGIMPEITAVDG